jgi:hypothetical protein
VASSPISAIGLPPVSGTRQASSVVVPGSSIASGPKIVASASSAP